MATSSTSDTSKVQNLDQEVRGPAELEVSSPNPAEVLQVEQDVTHNKSLDNQQITPIDRRQQAAEIKVVEEKEKIVTESRQSSPGAIQQPLILLKTEQLKDTASSPKEPQQNGAFCCSS